MVQEVPVTQLDLPVNNVEEAFEQIPEEPDDVLVVNNVHGRAHELLCRDSQEAEIVAFDAEWRPDWHWGSDNPVSVLQLAFPTSRRVYVVQVGRLVGKLPVSVQMMLVNPRVTKVAFAVDRADRAKMQRTGIAVTRDSVIDVQELCAAHLGLLDGAGDAKTGASAAERLGLKVAADRLLGVQLDKSLACSDWSSDRLTPDQVRYAALDAWVTLRLYYRTL
jgi:hypothetical protein